MTTRVLLVDDHEMVRAGFRIILGAQPDIEIVGEAASGSDAIARAAELDPDVICMDVQMAGMDGLEATRVIVADPSLHSAVLILTTFDHGIDVYTVPGSGTGCLPWPTGRGNVLRNGMGTATAP